MWREPYVLVAEPKMGVEPTTRTLDSVGRVLYRYEEALPTNLVDEQRVSGRLLVGFGRMAKLLLFDEPLAELTTTAIHEVGGHGGRGRELGLSPSFQFRLPILYRLIFSPKDDDETSAFTSFRSNGVLEGSREILGTLGGLEANYVHAYWINARIARHDGWVHHGDLLMYGATKLPYVGTFFSSSLEETSNTDAENDVTSYVASLAERSNLWRPEDRRRIAGRLRAGYLFNLADPTLLYAVFGTLESVYRGERATRMPLPTIGRTTVMISPRFNLTPFGAEQAVDVFMSRAGRLIDLYARVGTGGVDPYYGAGAKFFGIHDAFDRLNLGCELDVWRQPEILLGARGLYRFPQRLGVNGGVYADARFWRSANGEASAALSGKLSIKTEGYLMGQPVGAGAYGYLGLSVTMF